MPGANNGKAANGPQSPGAPLRSPQSRLPRSSIPVPCGGGALSKLQEQTKAKQPVTPKSGPTKPQLGSKAKQAMKPQQKPAQQEPEKQELKSSRESNSTQPKSKPQLKPLTLASKLNEQLPPATPKPTTSRLLDLQSAGAIDSVGSDFLRGRNSLAQTSAQHEIKEAMGRLAMMISWVKTEKEKRELEEKLRDLQKKYPDCW